MKSEGHTDHYTPSPEELAVHWLGGYWKLPKRDLASADLRERVVSA